MSDIPLSEQFRLSAKTWVERQAAADLLEECKSAFLSQLMARQGDMPVSRAELNVKASEEWKDYLEKMVKAREAANLCKVKLEWLRLKHSEWMSADANARAERKL